MNNLYLVGTENDVVTANAQIQQNAGIPYEGTTEWSTPTQAYQQNFWFIPMPIPDAIYNGHTGVELMQNVINVTQEPYDPNWLPPAPPP